MQINVGDLAFHGGDLPGATGFTVSSFSGWSDGPGQDRESSRRPGQHGAFDVEGFVSDGVVSWGGRYHGSSLADVIAAGRMLTGLGAVGSRVLVSVDWEGVLWAWARVSRIRFAPEGALPHADYQVELWLPDPFKYGETRETVSTGDSVTFGAIVQAHHRGNAAAIPKFTVTATSSMASGYQIKGKSRTFDVPGPLNVGSTDKIDFRTGQVLRNGVAVSGVVPQRFSVEGGELVDWRLWPLSGAGTATMHLTDTYA